jgi:serine/threonine-protein kinase
MFCPRCHREYDDEHRFCPYDGQTLVASRRRLESLRPRPTELRGALLGGRYEVRGFIGKGAMARVYLAEDKDTGDPVAVKVLDGVHARGAQARERFFREARAAARIGHPNIVQILDVGQREDGAPYLVLEFLFGESLGDFLRREQVMEAEIALPVLIQAAAGLAAAHDAGIVHRDVKPDNVFLVGEPGDPYAVKILDFGLAKLESQSGLTAAGIAVGTIEYMAPEQVVSDAPDARTDVYGLGVVMYRVFTGQLPFSAEDDAELLAQQLVLAPPSPSRRRAGVAPGVEAVTLKAMRKDPEHRYASMPAFMADLERLLGDRAGALEAASSAGHVDVYEPKTTFARNVGRFLYRKLAMEAPSWPR